MFDDEHDEHQKRPDDDSENDAGQDGQSNACSTHHRHVPSRYLRTAQFLVSILDESSGQRRNETVLS